MICSVWLAMDDVPRETCVSYVRGSHLWSLRHSISSFSGGGESNYDYGDQAGLESVPDVEALVTAGEADLLNWDMEAGDVIVFNSYAVQYVGQPLLLHPSCIVYFDLQMSIAAALRATPTKKVVGVVTPRAGAATM